jgi:hypothetical protein
MRYTRYLAVALALAAPCAGRPDGVGGHHGDHGAGHHVEHGASAASAPSTGYAQPATGYDTPSTGYQEPASSYDSYEQPSYATGSSGYESPSATGYENYEASAPGYGEVETSTGGFDMSTLLVPILIIAGLALLFPSVRTVPVTGTGRKRRAAGDSTENSLVERVQDIYMAVVESEECMERVACEVGGIAADAGVNKGMTKLAESFVPKKYQKMMKNFNSAKDCHKIKCGAF